MSDVGWDEDDFEPSDAATASETRTDKWDGEDEEESVKDTWDADDAAATPTDENGEAPATRAIQRKKKKKLADIIAEKEAAKEAELEARLKEQAAQKALNTPEAKLAEKLRMRKLEENANLQLAKDLIGDTGGSVDNQVPVTKEDFETFEKSLSDKVTSFSNSEHYADFVEALVKNLCLDLNAASLKKVKLAVEALHTTKLKDEKAAAAKGKKKGKGGALRMDTKKDILSGGGANYDDMEDFL